MVLYRTGRMSKMKKIKKALERAHNMEEASDLLDSSAFKLTSKEINEIIRDWHAEQVMLFRHGKGVYCQAIEA